MISQDKSVLWDVQILKGVQTDLFKPPLNAPKKFLRIILLLIINNLL